MRSAGRSWASGRRRRSWRWAPVPVGIGTLLVCLFYIQVCWSCPPAGPSGIPADETVSQIVKSEPTTTGLTTGFYEADIQGGPSSGDCAPSTPPTATVDTALDSVFANQQGPGWLGGDATYSTALPNGDEAFVFSDTLVGTAQANGRSSLTGVPHNSEMTGRLPNLGVDLNGTESSPQTLIPDQGRPGDSWQVASTYMENGNQLVFVNEFAPVRGSLFDNYTGRSGIAVMSLGSGRPILSSMTFVPTDPNTQWGSAMTQNAGYDYIYGLSMNTTSNIHYGMKVARVPVGESLDTGAWTYWNGFGWVAGESNGVDPPRFPLLNGVIPLQGATRLHGGRNRRLGRTHDESGPDVLLLADRTMEQPARRLLHSTDDRLSRRARVHCDIPPRAGAQRARHFLQHHFLGRALGIGRKRPRVSAPLHRDHPRHQCRPPVSAPEVPAPLLLPLSALALGGLGYEIKRWRSRRGNTAA